MKLNLFIIFFSLSFGMFAQSDTLNQKDSLGRKQGHWIFYGKDKPEKGYPAEGKISEGDYLNDRKNGEWIMYYKDGVTPKIKGDFINNRPSGPYERFDTDGTLKEKGAFNETWYKTKATSYWENGNISREYDYNENGKLHGKDVYYYENGQKKAELIYKNGILIDSTKHFFDDGDLKELIVYDSKGTEVKRFSDPQIIRDSSGREIYRIVEPPAVVKQVSRKPPPKTPEPCPQKGKVWDEYDQLLYEGDFKNCRLWNGKYYIYDKDGLLLKVEIYKNGKYFSNGQL
jgi:antitoxin component YwqK of YwqJK toxin-antitoxin module